MNTGIFAGRIGRDAETRQANGQSVTNFSVAVDVGFGDKKRTLWIGAAMWGERGEKVARYLTKGTAVTISGDVDLRQYDKKDGSAGAEITLNVQRLTLQGSRDGGSQGGQGGSQESQERRSGGGQPPSSGAAASGSDFEPDTDIPF